MNNWILSGWSGKASYDTSDQDGYYYKCAIKK